MVNIFILYNLYQFCLYKINIYYPSPDIIFVVRLTNTSTNSYFKMNLKLKGHVIIVDEAHNIEDQCREAASLQLDQTNMNLAKADCEKVYKSCSNSLAYSRLVRVYYVCKNIFVYYILLLIIFVTICKIVMLLYTHGRLYCILVYIHI